MKKMSIMNPLQRSSIMPLCPVCEFFGGMGRESSFFQKKIKGSLRNKTHKHSKDHVRDEPELEETYKAPSDLLHDDKKVIDTESLEFATAGIQRCMEYAERYENESPYEDVVVLQENSDESEVWDCETIVSTYSTILGKLEFQK